MHSPKHAPPARLLAAALIALLPTDPAGFADTWIGPGTDWNTAANWSPAAVPNSFTDDVIFGDTAVGTVNISSGVVARSITFSNSTGNYTLTSNAAQGLGITSITMAANVTGFDSINLATSATDSLQAPFFSNITVTNNSVAGGVLSIGSPTVIGVFGGAGGVVFQGPGLITLNATFASTSGVQVNGLTKNGPGSLDFTGNGAALVGATTLNGGTLKLDFANSTSQKAASGASLVLNNGILQLIANGSVSVTQAYTGGTTFNAGHTDIAASGNQPITLNLGGITRSVGGTTDFTSSGSTFFIPTTAGNTNGLLGTGTAFATISGGTTWATASGGQIIPFTAYSNNIVGSGVNADLTGGQFIALTVNSIRFSTANDSFNLLSPGTLQSGGILIAPTATGAAITGDTLTASNNEFVFHVYSSSGFFVSSSLIASNGLTKTGPGNLTLAGNNSGLGGPININRGNLTITTTAAVNSASTINFNDGRVNPGAALQVFTVDLGNGTTGTVSCPITVAAFSPVDYGTYFSTGNSQNATVTLSGALSSAPGLTTPIRFSAPTLNSGFNLTNPANSFTGNISILSGTLGITSDAVLGNAGNTLFLDTVNAATGGLLFLNSGINVARPVVINGFTHITSNGTDSNTLSGLISGSGTTLIKNGTGTLILSNPANSFAGIISVNSGTLSLGATGGFTSNPSLTINSGATFNPGTTTSPSFFLVQINGGTFRSTASFAAATFDQLTVSAGGVIDFTGSNGYQLQFNGVSPAIFVTANTTWLSPANNSSLVNIASSTTFISVAPNVILTNGIALSSTSTFGFTLTGGGTLFQNSDLTNMTVLAAPITVSQGTFRVTDISSFGNGNLGTGTFTLNGGTLSYGGTSATTTHAIALTANGGSIQVENAATSLTINAPITGPGTLTKTGAGTLTLSARTYDLPAITVTGGTLALGGATFTAAAFTNNSTVTGPATFTGGSFSNTGTFSNTSLLNSNVNFTNSGTFTQSGPQFWGTNTSFTNTSGAAAFSTSPDPTSAGHLSITVSGGTVHLASLDNLKALTLNGGGTTLTGVDTTTSLPTTIPIAASATLEFAASYDFTTAFSPTLTGSGQIIIDPGATLTLHIDTAFSGSIIINGTLSLAPAINPNAATFNFTILDAPAPVPEPTSLAPPLPASLLLSRRKRKPLAGDQQ